MRIILTQTELEAAAQQYALDQIAIQDGQEITVHFEDDDAGDLTAVISIGSTGTKTGERAKKLEPKKEASKPRGKKSSAEAPKDSTTETVTETQTETTTETPTETPTDGVAEAKSGETVPWDEQDSSKAETETETETETKPVAVPVAASSAPKIFQSPTTSAAPSTKPELAANPKSLFANLAKPVNGAH